MRHSCSSGLWSFFQLCCQVLTLGSVSERPHWNIVKTRGYCTSGIKSTVSRGHSSSFPAFPRPLYSRQEAAGLVDQGPSCKRRVTGYVCNPGEVQCSLLQHLFCPGVCAALWPWNPQVVQDGKGPGYWCRPGHSTDQPGKLLNFPESHLRNPNDNSCLVGILKLQQ